MTGSIRLPLGALGGWLALGTLLFSVMRRLQPVKDGGAALRSGELELDPDARQRQLVGVIRQIIRSASAKRRRRSRK